MKIELSDQPQAACTEGDLAPDQLYMRAGKKDIFLIVKNGNSSSTINLSRAEVVAADPCYAVIPLEGSMQVSVTNKIKKKAGKRPTPKSSGLKLKKEPKDGYNEDFCAVAKCKEPATIQKMIADKQVPLCEKHWTDEGD